MRNSKWTGFIFGAVTFLLLAATVAASISYGNDKLTLIVGTYTGSGSEGIYFFHFDQGSGEIEAVATDTIPEAKGAYGRIRTLNPSFLTVYNDRLYSVSEMDDSTACLNVFAFDKENVNARLLDSKRTGSADPCYVSVNGNMALTADYGGSLSAFALNEDGTLCLPQTFGGNLGGPDSTRQKTPHVHCAYFTPDGKHVLASDFSADALMEFDIDNDSLSRDFRVFPLNSDYGPRHITFSSDGKTCYVIGELSGDITVFSYREDGSLETRQVISADPNDARGAADIHISPDGRFLYASIRLKEDGISIFKIMPDGTLSPVGYQKTGIHPRNFGITPNGKFLLCACRDSDKIIVYRIDGKTGLLKATGTEIGLSKPVCIVFI
jgi:6-phosphogluconolactonase (cycloisomerase 2 family)